MGAGADGAAGAAGAVVAPPAAFLVLALAGGTCAATAGDKFCLQTLFLAIQVFPQAMPFLQFFALFRGLKVRVSPGTISKKISTPICCKDRYSSKLVTV